MHHALRLRSHLEITASKKKDTMNRQLGIVLFVLLSSIAVITPAAAQDAHRSPTSNPAADKDARISQLEHQLAQKQARLDYLEPKVGFPSPIEKWREYWVAWALFLIGMAGEGVFFLRFVVQWWASEKHGRTVVPMMFWYLSLIGTFGVLAYAAYCINWVFILAYSLNVFLYVRNLAIARRTQVATDTAGGTT